eukprot:CAMPEP_0169152532 /NCGR_PEP_ID=MMETSP1015-20121227/51560_1 /TAXON_ID=342587 /ORGANISM="Karlodinium micrum, Strain CCMP2283" /LENGTH=55 /DNA_ID=CAMNT_0009222325 /DNA_START=526 /DNA_END=693 /DNA_ORIENTATION=-
MTTAMSSAHLISVLAFFSSGGCAEEVEEEAGISEPFGFVSDVVLGLSFKTCAGRK